MIFTLTHCATTDIMTTLFANSLSAPNNVMLERAYSFISRKPAFSNVNFVFPVFLHRYMPLSKLWILCCHFQYKVPPPGQTGQRGGVAEGLNRRGGSGVARGAGGGGGGGYRREAGGDYCSPQSVCTLPDVGEGGINLPVPPQY